MEMLPYLELPAFFQSQDPEGKVSQVVLPLKFYPTSVVAYYPTVDGKGTFVCTASSQTFILAMATADYENALRKYFSIINNKEKGGLIRKLN